MIGDVDVYKMAFKTNIDNATLKIKDAKTTLCKHEKELGDVAPNDLRKKL